MLTNDIFTLLINYYTRRRFLCSYIGSLLFIKRTVKTVSCFMSLQIQKKESNLWELYTKSLYKRLILYKCVWLQTILLEIQIFVYFHPIWKCVPVILRSFLDLGGYPGSGGILSVRYHQFCFDEKHVWPGWILVLCLTLGMYYHSHQIWFNWRHVWGI